jgi:adenylate cyclase, class 2
MSSAGTKQEIEIKLRLESAEQGRRLLRQAGFRVVRRRVREDNSVFDRADLSLRAQGLLLRLRRAGRRWTLTLKGPSERSEYKSRLEHETAVSDPKSMEAILNGLGFRRVFLYEKFRTEYAGPYSGGVAMLDETLIGVFLELEGTPTWIEQAARRLGFEKSSYITISYGELYEDYRRRHKSVSPDMAYFSPHRRRSIPHNRE